MEKIGILLLCPAIDDPSPTDQSLGARLAAPNSPFAADLVLQEERFLRDDPADMERKLLSWQGKVRAVVGATNVPESVRLGVLAERLNLLCFVANNNPSVCQGRRHVFHIGLPTSQTTAAVATLIQKTNRRRVLLLHDQTEFQGRVASSMKVALTAKGMEPRLQAIAPQKEVEITSAWKPDLVYVIFSDERKALPIAHAIRWQASDIPILFGRSLFRESFLASLGSFEGDFWFVDMFHRNGYQTESQRYFTQAMAVNGVVIPTANHAFGWDGMKFCVLALRAAEGNARSAIKHLESGVLLEGASGTCSFSQANHNGRSGFGPTTLTRWHDGQLEDV